jgi:hypothetical protein
VFSQILLDVQALLEYYVWFDQPLKSSLGRSPKLNESIEEPFRHAVWLEALTHRYVLEFKVQLLHQGYVSMSAL